MPFILTQSNDSYKLKAITLPRDGKQEHTEAISCLTDRKMATFSSLFYKEKQNEAETDRRICGVKEEKSFSFSIQSLNYKIFK